MYSYQLFPNNRYCFEPIISDELRGLAAATIVHQNDWEESLASHADGDARLNYNVFCWMYEPPFHRIGVMVDQEANLTAVLKPVDRRLIAC